MAGVGTTPGEPPLQSGKAPFALKKDIIVASGSLSREPGEGWESAEARAGVLGGRWSSARVRERIKTLSCLLLTGTAVVHDSRFMSWAHPSQGFLAPQGVGGFSGDFQTVSWSDTGQRPRGPGTQHWSAHSLTHPCHRQLDPGHLSLRGALGKGCPSPSSLFI